jgi:glycerate dehydrogenase
MRIAILDGHATDQGDLAIWAPFQALGEVVIHPRTRPNELIARARGCAALLTNKAPVPGEAFAQLPELRYVGVTATGTNIVDLAAAAARGVVVTNVPGYSTEAVAQHVLALILHFTNDVAGLSDETKRGRWASSEDFCFFRRPIPELSGKSLAVVGSGAIGSAVGRIARAFGMQVLQAAVPGSTTPGRMPLAEALAQAHAVTLHCPLTPKTAKLVDDGFLQAMRPGAILVNTGRGGLIDEQAAARALASGRLGGFGLDVLAREPPQPDHPLLDASAPWSERVAVTPHVAWGAVEARMRLVAESAANLAAFQRGEPRNRVS